MRYKPTSPFNDRLVQILRGISPVQVQNTLMRRNDREIALAMSRMVEDDREFALSHLPKAKAQRIREEITYQKRLKVTEEQYERIVESLINVLSGGNERGATQSYIRPRNAKNSRM